MTTYAFNYTFSEAEFSFLCKAVKFYTEHQFAKLEQDQSKKNSYQFDLGKGLLNKLGEPHNFPEMKIPDPSDELTPRQKAALEELLKRGKGNNNDE